MPSMVQNGRSWFRPRYTIAFGTVITSLVNAANNLRTKVTRIKYTAGATAHTLTILRPLGTKQTYVQALIAGGTTTPVAPAGGETANAWVMTAVVAGGTSYVLSRDPGNYSANFLADRGAGSSGVTPLAANNLIASGDLLAIETAQPGVFFLATVSGSPATASNGQCTVTATAAPTGGIPAGAAVFFFGVTTDTDPRTGEAHPAYNGTASVTSDVYADGGSVAETVGTNEPLLFYSNNATATGTLEVLTGVYGP